MIDAKSLLVGAVAGVLSVVLGVSMAKADCSQDRGAAQLAAELDSCDTNYAEIVRDSEGYTLAWCVPDATAEACIELSSELDCSAMSEERCDETMGVMFQACIQLAYSGSVAQ